VPRQLVLPEAAQEYSGTAEQEFRRQVAMELRALYSQLEVAQFGAFPWVPRMTATVGGEDVIESGRPITSYQFEFETSDAALYPLDEVSDLSDETAIAFDPGGNPRQGATYTPSAPETAPKEFYALLRTGNVERTVRARVREGYLAFWGKSTSTSLNAVQIQALASEVCTGFAALRQLAAGSSVYAWLCWPSTWGAATGFTNAATGAAITFNAPIEVEVTNAYSVAATYYAYRSSSVLDAAVAVAVA
jgi:hypothetical protein